MPPQGTVYDSAAMHTHLKVGYAYHKAKALLLTVDAIEQLLDDTRDYPNFILRAGVCSPSSAH